MCIGMVKVTRTSASLVKMGVARCIKGSTLDEKLTCLRMLGMII